MQINIIIILLLVVLIINELIKYNNEEKKNKQQIKYKFITKPIYDKYLKDAIENDILLKDNIYNKMFSNPSPWMISRGIGILDKNDYRLQTK